MKNGIVGMTRTYLPGRAGLALHDPDFSDDSLEIRGNGFWGQLFLAVHCGAGVRGDGLLEYVVFYRVTGVMDFSDF